MDINFNIGFLKTVRQPIFESLNAALANVKENHAFVKEGKTSTGGTLNTDSLGFLHKAKGALHMIDLPGVVFVLQQAEDVQRKIKENALNDKLLNAFSELENAISNIILYVEQLCDGELDNPSKLFQNYEALAGLLNQEVNPKDLFFPKLDLLRGSQTALEAFYKIDNNYNAQRVQDVLSQVKMIVSSTHLEKNILEVCQTIEHFKTAYENSTVQETAGVLFVQNLENKTQEIKTSLSKLQALKINKHWHIVLSAAQALMDTLSPNENDNYIQYFAYHSKQIKFGLIKITQELTNLTKKLGEISLNSKLEPTQEVRKLKTEKHTQKEVIYCVCVATAVNPKLRQSSGFKTLNELINIDLYIEQLGTQTFTASVGQKDPELVKSLEKVLLDLKDEFVLVTSKTNHGEQSSYLKKMYNLASKLNETMGQLQIDTIKPLTQSLVDTLSKTLTKQIEFNDIAKEEFSLAINFTEKLVETYVKSNATIDEAEDVQQILILTNRLAFLTETGGLKEIDLPSPVLSKAVLATEKTRVNTQVFTQLAEDLIKAEEIIDEFFRKKGENVAELPFVITALNSSRGILAMTGKKDLSALVIECITTFNKLMRDTNSVSGDEVRKASSYIAGIILYVNALKNSNTQEAEGVYTTLLELSKPVSTEAPHIPATPNLIEETPQNKEENKHEESNMLDFTFVMPSTSPAASGQESSTIPAPTKVAETEKEEFDLSYSQKAPSEQSAFTDNQMNHNEHSFLVDRTNNEELCDIFLLEADEVLESLEADFEEINRDLSNEDAFKTIRRHFHTLKGSARMVGLVYLAEAAWLVEQTLNKQIENQTPPTSELIGFMQKTAEQIKHWVEALKSSDDKTLRLSLHEVSAWAKEVNPKAVFSFEIYPETSNDTTSVEEAIETIEFTHNYDIAESNVPSEELVAPVLDKEHDLSVADAIGVSNTNTAADENEEEHKEEPKFDFSFSDNTTSTEQEKEAEKQEEALHIIEDFRKEIEDVEQETKEPLIEVVKDTEEEISIPSFVVEDYNDEHETEEKEESTFEAEEPDYVLVGDVQVSNELYELYTTEGDEHLDNIEAYLEQAKQQGFDSGWVLSEDFTRYFHTLGSISGSVNLLLIKQAARLIEDISRVSLDKNYVLDEDAGYLLEEATDKIKEIKAHSIVEADEEFDDIMDRLNDLSDSVNAYQEIENAHDEYVPTTETESTFAEPEKAENNLDNNKSQSHSFPMLDAAAMEAFQANLVEQITSGVSSKVVAALQHENEVLSQKLEEILSATENNQERLAQVLEAVQESQNNSLEESFTELKNDLSRNLHEVLRSLQAERAEARSLNNLEENHVPASPNTGNMDSATEEKLSGILGNLEQSILGKLNENLDAVKEHNKRVMLNGLGIIRKDIQGLATQKKKFF